MVADYVAEENYETCLIYGHYDVQPAEKSEGWKSEPFRLAERSGRLYGRGVVDNKGQVLIHILTAFKLAKKNRLAYNIRFMIEGNEETGSPRLASFIKDHKTLLKPDFIMISDGEIEGKTPTIELGFRGTFNVTLKVSTSDRELHSGLFGGVAPNAGLELARILSSMYDSDGSLSIKELFESALPLPKDAVKRNKELKFDLKSFLKLTGGKKAIVSRKYDFYTRLGLLPAVEVTGVKLGYIGEGYRNSIPSVALAKINFRTAPHQEPKRVLNSFKNFLKSVVPKHVDWSLEEGQIHKGSLLKADNSYIRKAEDAMNKAYGHSVQYKYCGATLPIVSDIAEILNVPQVMAPLANEDCRMHAANENFSLWHLGKAFNFSELFLGQ